LRSSSCLVVLGGRVRLLGRQSGGRVLIEARVTHLPSVRPSGRRNFKRRTLRCVCCFLGCYCD
jgi:hypothetical protein